MHIVIETGETSSTPCERAWSVLAYRLHSSREMAGRAQAHRRSRRGDERTEWTLVHAIKRKASGGVCLDCPILSPCNGKRNILAMEMEGKLHRSQLSLERRYLILVHDDLAPSSIENNRKIWGRRCRPNKINMQWHCIIQKARTLLFLLSHFNTKIHIYQNNIALSCWANAESVLLHYIIWDSRGPDNIFLHALSVSINISIVEIRIAYDVSRTVETNRIRWAAEPIQITIILAVELGIIKSTAQMAVHNMIHSPMANISI